MKRIAMFFLLLSATAGFAAEMKTATEAVAETESEIETESESEVETDPLSVFVAGDYFLVGKAPDSTKTYHGKISINNNGGKLSVVRNINGVILKGSASIETTLGDEAKVLQMKFTEKGVPYEETCLVSGDLDNYDRISCYLYRADRKTKQPGMEVLFHDTSAE